MSKIENLLIVYRDAQRRERAARALRKEVESELIAAILPWPSVAVDGCTVSIVQKKVVDWRGVADAYGATDQELEPFTTTINAVKIQ